MLIVCLIDHSKEYPMKKLIAAILTFISFAASANTILYNAESPFPTHTTMEDACTSKSGPTDYKEGIEIVISKMVQCSNGDYVAESELLEQIKYFKIPSHHNLRLFSGKPNFDVITPQQALSYGGQSGISNTELLTSTFKKGIKDKFIFDYQMHWPTEYGMDDTFNFQITNRSLSSYTQANTIKYIEITVDFYNAVDDKVKSKKFTGIGPIASYGSYTFDSQFYGVIEYGIVRTVKLTFMDGKTKSMSAASIILNKNQQRFFNTNCWFSSRLCHFQ